VPRGKASRRWKGCNGWPTGPAVESGLAQLRTLLVSVGLKNCREGCDIACRAAVPTTITFSSSSCASSPSQVATSATRKVQPVRRRCSPSNRKPNRSRLLAIDRAFSIPAPDKIDATKNVAKGRGGIEGNAASKRSEGGGSIVTVHADRKTSERRSKSIVLTVSNGCSGVTDRPCSILFIHSSPQE
jgi:hypothetical protein